MPERPEIDNLISFLPRAAREGRQPVNSSVQQVSGGLTTRDALWSVLAVHTRELEQQGVIDEAGLATIARALDSVRLHRADDSLTLAAIASDMEHRVDTLLPAEFSGVSTLGLAREDWQGTAVRLQWLDAVSSAGSSFQQLRLEMVGLAEQHVMTLMPAMYGGRPAQPTMLGHYLGGIVSALASASARFDLAQKGLARSPLGAGLLAGEMIAIDRERVARILGFEGPVVNTFDATSNVEDYVSVLEALAAALAPVARLLREFLSWIRTSPNSLVLTGDWESKPEPTIPTLATSGPLGAFVDRIDGAIANASMLVGRLRGVEYGPLGAMNDVLARVAWTDLPEATAIFDTVRGFLRDGVLINRAYLGNRAGRGHTTVGDLAAFLMTEEQLPPSAARGIASIVAGKLAEQSLETSSVTQEMIDSAALLLIGREIKVEIETVGRYLAPRRFIERRQVTGSPAAEEQRAWLAMERERLNETPRPNGVSEALARLQADIADLASREE